jgi:hypothetical protein
MAATQHDPCSAGRTLLQGAAGPGGYPATPTQKCPSCSFRVYNQISGEAKVFPLEAPRIGGTTRCARTPCTPSTSSHHHTITSSTSSQHHIIQNASSASTTATSTSTSTSTHTNPAVGTASSVAAATSTAAMTGSPPPSVTAQPVSATSTATETATPSDPGGVTHTSSGSVVTTPGHTPSSIGKLHEWRGRHTANLPVCVVFVLVYSLDRVCVPASAGQFFPLCRPEWACV